MFILISVHTGDNARNQVLLSDGSEYIVEPNLSVSFETNGPHQVAVSQLQAGDGNSVSVYAPDNTRAKVSLPDGTESFIDAGRFAKFKTSADGAILVEQVNGPG